MEMTEGHVTPLLDLQLPLQAVPITTKVWNLNPAHGDLY
jgi:hypothetical protein